MSANKLNINVLIENDQKYGDEFVSKQKLQVIVNKAKANFKIDVKGRVLRREDGTPLTDLSKTIEEAGINDGEILRFFKKSKKPDRDERFA